MNVILRLFLIVALMQSGSLLAQQGNNETLSLIYQEVDNDYKYGYINSKGEVIVPIGKYSWIYHTKFETLGFVAKDGNIWAIDPSGKERFRVFCFDNGPDYLSEGLFRMVDEQSKIGFADSLGHIVITPRFEFVSPFKNGLAAFNAGGKKVQDGEHSFIEGGKWGYVNLKGDTIYPAIFDSASYYIGDKTTVKYKGKVTTIGQIDHRKE